MKAFIYIVTIAILVAIAHGGVVSADGTLPDLPGDLENCPNGGYVNSEGTFCFGGGANATSVSEPDGNPCVFRRTPYWHLVGHASPNIPPWIPDDWEGIYDLVDRPDFKVEAKVVDCVEWKYLESVMRGLVAYEGDTR